MNKYDDKRDNGPNRPTGNPYVDWPLRLFRQDPSRLRLQNAVPPISDKQLAELPLWLPISIRIAGSALGAFQEAYASKDVRDDNRQPDLVVENWQFEVLAFAEPEFWDVVVYVKIDAQDIPVVSFPDYVGILRFDPPITQFQLPQVTNDRATAGMLFSKRSPFSDAPAKATAKTMVGIIDDGIGFLNARFMRDTTSRFAAHWIMSDPANAAVFSPIQSLAADLNTKTEAEVYNQLAKQAYLPGTRHRMLSMRTHGTHMLDLAAGADPADPTDPVRNIDLLGVQIRPQSYDDTSGAGITPDLQRGLFFLWLTAWFQGSRHLMVNISLGITAGPKDGTSQVEVIIRDAIRMAAMLGLKIDVFLPYGNAYHDQLAAELCVTPEEPKPIHWQIQPNDLTPGYFEIQQLDGGSYDLNELELTFTSPAGTTQTVTANASGTINSDIVMNGVTCGTVSHVPARGRRQHLIVAFAPSRSNPEMTLPGARPCPAGRWTLTIAAPKGAVALTLQMQRDDRPEGVLPGAYQAYFEGPNTRDHDQDARQFTALGDEGPVVYLGTNSAYTEVNHTNVTSVGGAMVRAHEDPGQTPQIKPAHYTAKGTGWSGSEPDLGAATEKSAVLPGLLAAGTFSNGTARMSGTSTASASALRHALEAILGVGFADIRPIFGLDRARIGSQVILDNRAVRRRT
ncbi:hypothetical protein [Roseobacter sp. CCS2]|uniref:hypothetical protein n=1 Tax=Roseobacter sp. CCS2 TaxID=391593 RepID=UPI0000F3FBCB|nr:hypothetical protein [Roseobacter sp. CCS2]EBA10918.1 hypothetical protein RCCS2_00512 [Roseobacter sp. CCS2]